MRKIFTLVLAAGLLTMSAAAQTTTAATPRHGRISQKEMQIQDAIKQLDLNVVQNKKLRLILDNATAQLKVVKKDPGLSAPQRTKKTDYINAEKASKLKGLLGEVKYSQWVSIRTAQHAEDYPEPRH